ncbi:MAG: hypothetical protein ACLUW4_06370 [Butyribacter sp.]|uniref:hypothetical protein n=1 Tax=Butyribacter sp. TaxID=2822465 RepID=UPI00384028FF|nr:hypothetical protein [Roseburia hominis]
MAVSLEEQSFQICCDSSRCYKQASKRIANIRLIFMYKFFHMQIMTHEYILYGMYGGNNGRNR